jgi:ribonucleotide reductase alpha subunit
MVSEFTIYDELSEERKKLQDAGNLPSWVTTFAWQMLKENYLSEQWPDLKSAYTRISKHASTYTKDPEVWEKKFFNLLWNGWLSASTPVLANMGTGLNCPVSCFVAGTMVNTISGLKPIEELVVGDLVLTHTGKYQPVIDTMNRESDDLYQLEFKGEVFYLTSNHLVLTKEDDWVRADELDPLKHNIVQISEKIEIINFVINKISKKDIVYDITVKDDHSFTVGKNKIVVHNCSGQFIDDSVYAFYESQKEAAVLSKNGFGTSGYLGAIRHRGSKIKGIKGSASGVLPVFKDFVQMSRDISQGSQRRGAWAGYIEIDHADFFELVNYISKNPDDANIGWNISDKFIERLDNGDKDAISRYQKALKLKMITGKGYFFFVDKVNRQNPQMYKDKGLKVLASNLCVEINLAASDDFSFACVLSSMNLSMYDDWKDTDAIFDATVFLDCVNQDLIEIGKNTPGLEKIVKFAEESRALGLGTLGFHTYLQEHSIPFESMEAYLKNIEIFKLLDSESKRASEWMAVEFGEPEWCKGYGLRNTHRIAIPPTLSSSIICASVSQGIEPIYKNAYVQNTAAGKIDRINPTLLKIMKEKLV